MDWITTINGLIALITGLCGLVGTGIGAFLAIKTFIKASKEKTARENLALLMSVADAVMKEVEHSTMSGADKKATVMNAIKAAAKEAGIAIEDFIDQLDKYIDSCIDWYNGMKK